MSHRVLHDWGSVDYWSRGVACDESDNWDRADVYVHPHSGVTQMRIPTKTVLRYTINSLDRAFEWGRRARSSEILRILENKS